MEATELLGINIDKFFMPSVANVVGTDLSKYKVVKKGQFACNRMHVGRDYRIPIALSDRDEPFIVSPAYDVFEIIRKDELLDEYLMMWFSRPEFDRNAWFHTDADVRGGLPWNMFCSLELPVPTIEKQREIVKEYNTVVSRIKLNEQLNQKLQETAQSLYKHWFVDFEFPDENGNPYKSSGGKMVWNEELEKEIPEGWDYRTLGEITEKIFSGGTPNTSIESYWGNEFYWISSGETRDRVIIDSERMITQKGVDESSAKLALIGDSIMATAGQGKTRGQTSFCKIDTYINQSVLCIRPIESIYRSFIFFNLSMRYAELRNESDGQSIRGSLNKDNLSLLPMIIPSRKAVENFEKCGSTIIKKIYLNRCVTRELMEMKDLLLVSMTQVEVEENELA
ncbi:MAG: restriction endonuclease subunit S [Cyclobacteriaceae bacterium]